MLNHKDVLFGNLKCIIYDFENVDDILPEHSHSEPATHITICCRGRVLVKTPDWNKVLETGDIIQFFPNQRHSVTALEANSKIINVPNK